MDLQRINSYSDSISSIVDEKGGSVLVVKIKRAAWATYSVDRDVTDWMKENI